MALNLSAFGVQDPTKKTNLNLSAFGIASGDKQNRLSDEQVTAFKAAGGQVISNPISGTVPAKESFLKTPQTLNTRDINIRIPFTQKYIPIKNPFDNPVVFGGQKNNLLTTAANFAANLPTDIIQAIPRAAVTIKEEFAHLGMTQDENISKNVSPLYASLYGNPQYKNVNADIKERLARGDGILASYLGAISGKALDVVFGASVAATGLKTLGDALTNKDTISAIEAWKTLGSPKNTEELAYNYRELVKQFHPDKVGGSDAPVKIVNRAKEIVDEHGIPSILDRSKTEAARYAEVVSRQTKLGEPIMTPDLTMKETVQPKETLPFEALPGYRERPGQPAPVGLSIREVEPVGFGQEKKTTSELDPNQARTYEEGARPSGLPSNSIVAANLPKPPLETNLSPSFTKIRLPAEAPRSIKYVSPSHLYNLADNSIYSDYNKAKAIGQANQEPFTQALSEATGLTPEVRVKSKESYEGKIERLQQKNRPLSEISDLLAGRVVIKPENIGTQIKNISKSFDVEHTSNYFKEPTDWGYTGVNIKVNLPGGSRAEIQIHTPESLAAANEIHKVYEKWRNVDIQNLSPEDIIKREQDRLDSVAIAEKYDTLSVYKTPKESALDLSTQDVNPSSGGVIKLAGTNVSKSATIDQLFSMLRREEESLGVARANPAAHAKAYGGNRIPKYEARIKALKRRIEELPTDGEPEMEALIDYLAHEKPTGAAEKLNTLMQERQSLVDQYNFSKLQTDHEEAAYTKRFLAIVRDSRARSIKEVLADGDIEQVKKALTKRGIEYQNTDFDSQDANLTDDEYLDVIREKITAQNPATIHTRKVAQNLGIESNAAKQRKKIEALNKELAAAREAVIRENIVTRDTGALKTFLDRSQKYTDKEYARIASAKNKPTAIQRRLAERMAIARSRLEVLLEATYNTQTPLEREALDTLGQLTQQAYNLSLEEFESMGAGDPLHKIVIDSSTSVKHKVRLIDYLRTPDRVLKRVGLGELNPLIRHSYESYLNELPMHLDVVREWKSRVPEAANKSIFQYLDGQMMRDSYGGKVVVKLSPVEMKIAQEIKAYLSEWADRLGLPEDERLSHYITHVFGIEKIEKEFDEDLAKLIVDKVPGSVYDPFLQKRLGKKGYIEDTWLALDAYIKRAVRKANMDPALERLKNAVTLPDGSSRVELSIYNYVKRYVDRINLRPTEIDNLTDNWFKDLFGYKFGARPTAVITRMARQLVYRAFLGLNSGSAVKNLTQGVNTYARLGEKYTVIGYAKLATFATNPALREEFLFTGILKQDLIQDKALSAAREALQKMDKVLFFQFQAAEFINRGAAYLGAKAKALDAGKNEMEAIEYAKRLVRDTQFNFGSIDTPVGLGSDLAKLFSQFMTFGFKQVEFATETLSAKDWAGILRYIAAATVLLIGAGKALNFKTTDFVPGASFTKFGLPPTFNFPVAIISAITNQPGYFGQQRDIKDKAFDIMSTVPIPASLQAQKTYRGLQTYLNPKKKVDHNPLTFLKAALLGSKNLAPVKKPSGSAIKTASIKIPTVKIPSVHIPSIKIPSIKL